MSSQLKPVFNLGIEAINYEYFCKNKHPEAIRMIEEKIRNDQSEDIDWKSLSSNPSAMNILLNNMDKVCLYNLSINPSALDYLESNRHQIRWVSLAKNPNIRAIDLLSQHLENPRNMNDLKPSYVFQCCLSQNPNAHILLERFPELRELEMLRNFNANTNLFKNPLPSATSQIYEEILRTNGREWITPLSENINPQSFAILEKYLETPDDVTHEDGFPTIDTYTHLQVFTRGLWNRILSRNSAAIGLLERNPVLINWTAIWENDGIFENSQA
jgi:hypothetical protein